MTPLQLAGSSCANLRKDGEGRMYCQGIGIADNMRCYRWRKPGPCLLMGERPVQCEYLASCVLPVSRFSPDEKSRRPIEQAALAHSRLPKLVA